MLLYVYGKKNDECKSQKKSKRIKRDFHLMALVTQINLFVTHTTLNEYRVEI